MVMEERKRDRINKKSLIKVEGQTCVMADMSRSGMRLVLPVLLKKQTIDITFRMESLTLDLQGIVRWIKKEPTVYDQAQYQVGVYLIDPPEEYTLLIDKLLSDLPVE
jgi:hypothetical protein